MRIITKDKIRGFKIYLIEEEKSDNTIEKYIRDLGFFAEWLGDRNVDKGAVIEYKKKICEKYAPKSVNSALSSINAFFVYMGWMDLKVKTLKIQRQIFADKEKELTKEEYERLLTAAKGKKDERLYYLIQTIGSTGVRISELKYITVDAINEGQATINCKGKIRRILLPKQLCKILASYIKRHQIKNGSVFVTRNGKAIDRSTIWKMLKKLCDVAKVSKSKVFPHNLRHLFARTFYAMQKDIVRLADILGHSSIETTRIYTVESGDVHIMQLQKLGLLRC